MQQLWEGIEEQKYKKMRMRSKNLANTLPPLSLAEKATSVAKLSTLCQTLSKYVDNALKNIDKILILMKFDFP
jgi:hypothetical protein